MRTTSLRRVKSQNSEAFEILSSFSDDIFSTDRQTHTHTQTNKHEHTTPQFRWQILIIFLTAHPKITVRILLSGKMYNCLDRHTHTHMHTHIYTHTTRSHGQLLIIFGTPHLIMTFKILPNFQILVSLFPHQWRLTQTETHRHTDNPNTLREFDYTRHRKPHEHPKISAKMSKSCFYIPVPQTDDTHTHKLPHAGAHLLFLWRGAVVLAFGSLLIASCRLAA
jgi:hypothetical protein